MNGSITVITLTQGRPCQLSRAIASVREQDYAGELEHLIIIDNDRLTAARLSEIASTPRRAVRWQLVERPSDELGAHASSRASIYPRLGRLLNIGVRAARFAKIAFLDDDNIYEPDHLSSLASCAAASRSSAVHSARAIYNQNGTPYLDHVFPWAPSRSEGERIYAVMVRRGVWQAGTNILVDRVDPHQSSFANSTVLSDDDPMFMVDQNLWLIDRAILLSTPYPETFSADEIAHNTCPDDKLLEQLYAAGIRISSSGRATVRYYLGGISNGPFRSAT